MTWFDPVFVFVLPLQIYLFGRALVHARGDDSDALDALRERRFEPDILDRARRGDGPDWVRYMDEADRVHERRIDRLRVWATAALVVGIGGTMGALALRILGGDPQSPVVAIDLMDALGPALLASLLGVGNNLLITLGLFRLSDRRFEGLLDQFRDALQETSDENPPREQFADAVRDQLGDAFREAVRSFPDAFARLGEELTGSADNLTAAVQSIAPVADLLRESTQQLYALPERLAGPLEELHARWEQEIRSGQDSFVAGVREVLERQQGVLDETHAAFTAWEQERRAGAAQWRAAVEMLQKWTAEMAETIEGLPGTFRQEVEQTADTMGRQFGLEARHHVEDLSRTIRASHGDLGKTMAQATRELHRSFLDESARVLQEMTSLQEVGVRLRDAVNHLPENANGLAASLTAADAKLQQTIEHLKRSADHLQRVASLNEQFRTDLTSALKEGTRGSFEPAVGQLQEIVSELRRSAGIPERRVGFWRRLFHWLTGRGWE